MSFSDADLISRVLLVGDQNAYGELVRRYQSAIRGFLLKLVRGDAYLADDIAQEAFVKAWEKLDTFRGEARFQTWLFGIAFNAFRQNARRRKELSLDDLDEPPPEAECSDSTEQSNLRLDLAQAMESLTRAERAAIILCYHNGLTHEEAAQVLDVPLGTVKTNILRGKEKLKAQLVL